LVRPGEAQSFTLNPAPGYAAYMGGTCSGTLDAAGTTYKTSPITTDCTVVASFAPKQPKVTATTNGGGTISPVGTITVNYNDTQKFTLNPSGNYGLAGVDSDCGGKTKRTLFNLLTGNTTYKTDPITDNCSVRALFGPKVESKVSGGGGTISPQGTVPVVLNEAQQYTLAPNAGYEVVNVTGNNASCTGTLSADKKTFTTNPITQACTFTATFALRNLTVTSEVVGCPSCTLSQPKTTTVKYGDKLNYTWTTPSNYKIGPNENNPVTTTCAGNINYNYPLLIIGNILSLDPSSFKIGPITDNCTVTVRFVQK